MGDIIYKINSGLPPFEVTINPNPNNWEKRIHTEYGMYSYVGLPSGTYFINIKDATNDVNCEIDLTYTIPEMDLFVNSYADCNNDTVYVEITGGTAPYQISLDGGDSFIGTTNDDNYTITGATSFEPSGVYDIFVVDDMLNNYWFGEVTCNQLSVTYIPIYLTSTSIGTIVDESNVEHNETFIVDVSWGTTYETNANVSGTTEFLGWSRVPPKENRRGGYDIRGFRPFNSNPHFENKIYKDDVVYGVFYDNQPDIISVRACYFDTSGNTGNTDFLCGECPVEVFIYADRSDYIQNGYEGATWYNGSDLVNVIDDGYYRLSNNRQAPIYNSENGLLDLLYECNQPDKLIC